MEGSEQYVMTRDVGVRERAAELIHQVEGGHRLQLAGQLVEPEADRLAPAVGAVGDRPPARDAHQQRVRKILSHHERDWHRDARHADSVVASYRHTGRECLCSLWRLGLRTCWNRPHPWPTFS